MPAPQSVSFHGRDLFAPAAARIAYGRVDWDGVARKRELDVTFGRDDAPYVVYIDHYGNAITGIRASAFAPNGRLRVPGRMIEHARVFSDVPPKEPF